MNEDWENLGRGARFSLSTAGPSIFIDVHTDGVQMLSAEDAQSLRDWLYDAIERMKEFEAQR